MSAESAAAREGAPGRRRSIVARAVRRAQRFIRKLRWELVRGRPGGRTRILTVKTANGLLSFSNMDVHNARGLFVQRAWEPELIVRVAELTRRERAARGREGADLLIDAGANIGMICIAMVRQGHFDEAVAVEPDPENFALLERNIGQNALRSKIRAVRCALTDAPGVVELERSEVNFGDHRVRPGVALSPAARGAGAAPVTAGIPPGLMGEETRRVVRVPARTLDEVLASEGMDSRRVGLVWVDVQGHEGFLLQGARETLRAGAPVLSEFWPYGIRRSGMSRDDYVGIVRSLFSRFVVLDASSGGLEERPASSLTELFERVPGPDQYLEILYLPE